MSNCKVEQNNDNVIVRIKGMQIHLFHFAGVIIMSSTYSVLFCPVVSFRTSDLSEFNLTLYTFSIDRYIFRDMIFLWKCQIGFENQGNGKLPDDRCIVQRL